MFRMLSFAPGRVRGLGSLLACGSCSVGQQGSGHKYTGGLAHANIPFLICDWDQERERILESAGRPGGQSPHFRNGPRKVRRGDGARWLGRITQSCL